MSEEYSVELKGIRKSFGSAAAVRDADFGIRKGEFFALLGPSGCGKTTLLRMIAGFEFPDQGSIWIQGKDMANVPANERPVNMVFQHYALFPHLSVFENVAFGLRIHALARGRESTLPDRGLGRPESELPSPTRSSPADLSNRCGRFARPNWWGR